MTLEAVLLVGGRGTRLRPLTVRTPKPLLPVAGVPFVTHQLARLRAAGVARVVLGTSYQAEMFAACLGVGSALGLELEYVTEPVPLGTGGAVRNVTPLLRSSPGDPVLVLNGDVLSGHDLAAQVAEHRRVGAAVTLHLTRVADPRAFGCVPTDATGRVVAFLEKTVAPPTDQVNAGCYVFDRSVLDGIQAGRPVSVERETFPGLLSGGALLQAYVEPAYWLDVGTPAAFVACSADLVLGRAPSSAVPATGPALVLAGAVVAPDAVLVGGCAVGAACRVGAGAVVDGSVLFDGVVVEEGAVIRRSVVGRGSSVGAGSVLDEAVVGDDVRIGAGNELRAGVRLWPGTVLGDGALRFSSDV